MRKVIFTLATGLFLVAGVSTSSACDSHGKKVQKASTQAAVTAEKKECSTAEKKECATTTKTAKMASGEKSCCASKSKGVEATNHETKTATAPAVQAKL